MNESPHPTATFSIYEDPDKSGRQESCNSEIADGHHEQLDLHVQLTNLCNGRKKYPELVAGGPEVLKETQIPKDSHPFEYTAFSFDHDSGSN